MLFQPREILSLDSTSRHPLAVPPRSAAPWRSMKGHCSSSSALALQDHGPGQVPAEPREPVDLLHKWAVVTALSVAAGWPPGCCAKALVDLKPEGLTQVSRNLMTKEGPEAWQSNAFSGGSECLCSEREWTVWVIEGGFLDRKFKLSLLNNLNFLSRY